MVTKSLPQSFGNFRGHFPWKLSGFSGTWHYVARKKYAYERKYIKYIKSLGLFIGTTFLFLESFRDLWDLWDKWPPLTWVKTLIFWGLSYFFYIIPMKLNCDCFRCKLPRPHLVISYHSSSDEKWPKSTCFGDKRWQNMTRFDKINK